MVFVALSAHAASTAQRAMTLERDTFDMICSPLYVVELLRGVRWTVSS
jgi:hypothetical protein